MQLFGFGKGSVELTLDKANYKFGETIKGRAVLKLKNPVEANGVRVKFFGEELVYQSSSSPAGLLAGAMGAPGASRRNDDRSSKKVIHKFETNLDGKKTYNGGESYDFEIAIPQDVGGKKPAGGMGAALGALEFMSGRSSSVSWFVQISLDIPNTIDVKKSVQVNIT